MIKVKALKSVEILTTIGSEEKWIFLKSGQELDGVGMVLGVDPRYAPGSPAVLRGVRKVVLFPIEESEPRNYFGFIEASKTATQF